MKLSNALVAARWRTPALAVVLTMDPTAQLSPGALHATMTGTITCDPGDNPSVSGQIVATKSEPGGYGSTMISCDGTTKPFAIDVSTGSGFPYPLSPTGPFKAGKATAQVSTSICDPWYMTCSTKYADGEIKLLK